MAAPFVPPGGYKFAEPASPPGGYVPPRPAAEDPVIRAILVPDLATRRLTPACRRRHLRWDAIVIDRWAIFDGQSERGGRHYFVVGRAWTRCGAFDLARAFINATTKGTEEQQ